MTEHPHQQTADQLAREVDHLQRRGEQLDAHIDEAREKWEAHKRDPDAPGTPAVPKEPEEGEDSTDERQGPEAASAKA
jgi:hypothetical protein